MKWIRPIGTAIAVLTLGAVGVVNVNGVASGVAGASDSASAEHGGPARWVGAWANAEEPPATAGMSATGFTNQTLRMVAHVSAGGAAVRIRLSNLYGTTPLDIGAVDVAARAGGAATVPGTRRVVSFSGRSATTIPRGAQAVSDPVTFPVAADTDVVVSVYLPTATGPATYHNWAHQTNYVSTAGDHTAEDAAAAFPTSMTSTFFLQGVDVSSTTAAGTVVAFGDSITEGGYTAADSNLRWPDDLGRRLAALPRGHQLSVVNEGIGGNNVLTDGGVALDGTVNLGVSAEARFGFDALAQAGVRDVIFMEGTNDIGLFQGVHPGENLTADQLIAGVQNMVAAAHAAGVAIYGGTITVAGRNNAAEEAIREQVNSWIRTSGAFDGVVDFDQVLRDPANPQQLLPAYDSGDHLHPNDAGMQAMANAVKIDALRR
jgi:lysophospholipase L1-like esterase